MFFENSMEKKVKSVFYIISAPLLALLKQKFIELWLHSLPSFFGLLQQIFP